MPSMTPAKIFRLTPPTLEDFRDDQQRLFDGLLEQEPSLQGLELDIRILPQLHFPGLQRM